MPEHGKPFVPDRHTYSLIRSSRILSLGEKILLEEIVYRCGRKDHCWPSKSTLAEGVGTDRGTISRRLKKLEEKGLIRRVESDLSTKKTYIIWSDGIYRGWGRCALSSEGAVHSAVRALCTQGEGAVHSPNEDPSLYRFLNKKLKEKGETENPPVIENLKPKTAGSEKASCIDRGSVVDWNLLTSIDQAILQFRDHQGTLYDILLKLCKEACLKFGRPSNIQKTFLKAHDRDEDTLRDVIRFCLEDLEGWESDVASRVACYLGWNRYWKLGDQPRRRSSGFTSPSGPARPGPRDTAPADARSPEAIRGLAAALRRKNKNLSEEESIAIAKQELGVA